MQERGGDYNLLVIVSDQHRADVAGYSGHPVVKTPHLDRLAGRGVRFARAYCQSPLCGPSRRSLLTGTHCHTCNALTQKTDLNDRPTIGGAFRDAGYATAFIGKMHVIGETRRRDLGFDHRELRYDTYDMQDYVKAVGADNARKYAPGWGEFRKETYNPRNRPVDLDERLMFDSLVVERSVRFLEQHGRERFCLWVGLEKPHPAWYAPAEYHRMYSPDDVIVPDDYNRPLENVPDSMIRRQAYLESHTYAEQEARGCIAAYYANVTWMDECVGRLLAALERLGLADTTVVVYTSDHGELLFQHGWVQKHCFYEPAVRAPLILAGPAGDRQSQCRAIGAPAPGPQGRVWQGIVSLIDLFPTFVELFGLDRARGLEGESLLPLLRGEAGTGPRAAFSEYYWTSAPARMIRTPEWKYAHTQGETPQLYDMIRDPGERHNLAQDPRCRAACRELAERVLDGWEVPALPVEMTARESRYREKAEFLRRAAGRQA